MLAQYGLFSSQWSTLKLLMEEQPLTPADIAVRQHVEKPSITKVLQRLKELNYIEATPGEDKREKWIRLTDSGNEVCIEMIDKLNTVYSNVLKDIPEQEIEKTIGLFDQAYRNLSR